MKQVNLQIKIIIIMTVILISGFIGGGYFWGKNAVLNKQIKLIEELNAGKLAVKDLELAELTNKIAAIEDNIIELEKDNIKLKKERDANKEEIKKLKKKIEDASPGTLLTEARRILDIDEIWLIHKATGRLAENAEVTAESIAGIEFSLLAFRKAVWIFTDWENFTLIREPSYLKQVENDAKIKTEQLVLISNWKLSSEAWEEKYYILNNSFVNWKKYIDKKQTLWKWLSDKALVFSLGYFAGKFGDKIL